MQFNKDSAWVMREVPEGCEIVGLQCCTSKKGSISRLGFVAALGPQESQ